MQTEAIDEVKSVVEEVPIQHQPAPLSGLLEVHLSLLEKQKTGTEQMAKIQVALKERLQSEQTSKPMPHTMLAQKYHSPNTTIYKARKGSIYMGGKQL